MRDPDNLLLFFMFGLVALIIASYVALIGI